MDRDLFEHFPGPVLLVEADGTIIEANEWACNIWDLGLSELIGRNVTKLIGVDVFKRVLETGDVTFQRGKTKWNGKKRGIFCIATPAPDESNRVVLAIMKGKNDDGDVILEQLETTKAFIEHFQHAKIGLLVVNERGHFLHANDVILELVGMPGHEAIGRIAGFAIPGYKMLVFDAMSKKEVLKEVRHVTFGERKRSLDVTAIPIMKGERVVGGLSIVCDVTDKVNMEKKLIDSERMFLVGEMAARIMHDIRNPLQIVKSSVQMVGMWNEKDAMDRDKTRAMLANIDTAVNSVIEMVNDLLQFSKPVTEKMELVSLRELLEKLAWMLSSSFSKYQVDFELDASEPSMVWGNRKLIRQAVWNIVQNALEVLQDYNGKRRLAIRVCEGADKVFVEIYNAGPAIEEKIIPRIFDTFFSTKGTKGTGLGLSITKEIVESHGGRISCVSSVENKGTSFLIEFPKAIVDAGEASQLG